MHVSRFVWLSSSVLSHACFLWHHEHLHLWVTLHFILLLCLQWCSELLQMVDVEIYPMLWETGKPPVSVFLAARSLLKLVKKSEVFEWCTSCSICNDTNTKIIPLSAAPVPKDLSLTAVDCVLRPIEDGESCPLWQQGPPWLNQTVAKPSPLSVVGVPHQDGGCSIECMSRHCNALLLQGDECGIHASGKSVWWRGRTTGEDIVFEGLHLKRKPEGWTVVWTDRIVKLGIRNVHQPETRPSISASEMEPPWGTASGPSNTN